MRTFPSSILLALALAMAISGLASAEVGIAPFSIASMAASPAAEVVIDEPLDASHLNVTTVTVRWHLTDAAWQVQYYLVKVDEGAWVNNSLRTSITLLRLDDGSHVIRVQAWSVLGQNCSDKVEFDVDTVAPLVTAHSPNGNQVPLGSNVAVSFSELMDRSSVVITGVSGLASWSGRNLSLHTNEPLVPGQVYTIAVSGKDLAGNPMAAHSWSFRATDEGSITGTVRDEREETVVGATVDLLQDGGVVASGTTDSDGRFVVTAPAGTYNLTISSSAIVTKSIVVNVTMGQTSDIGVIDVALAPNYSWVWIDGLIVGGGLCLLLVGRRRERIPGR